MNGLELSVGHFLQKHGFIILESSLKFFTEIPLLLVKALSPRVESLR